jgi:hypothetical protein
MTISAANADNEIKHALAVNSSQLLIDKGSIANAAAGQIFSLWRATGQPGQGAIPTVAALATKALTGALPFNNQTSPVTNFLAWLSLVAGNSALGIEVHDRIAHQAGLVLNVTTTQITNLPISLVTLAPPAARLGEANYSSGQWFLEVYSDGGATASNATIAVTYNDGTTGSLNVQAVGGTLRAGRLIPLTPLIPAASQGKFIRSVDSVFLSASTGTAGNFGFTYMRPRTAVGLGVANAQREFDWAQLGLPETPNDSCLQFVMNCSTTTTGLLRGQGKIAHI